MRVMFITPAASKTNVRWMPLGVCSLAGALLAAGHEVLLFDRFRISFDHDQDEIDRQLKASISAFRPDMIGFSTCSQLIHHSIHDVRVVRSVTDAFVVLGGHHATALPELTLQRIPEADAVIAGEGEESICLLADKHCKNDIPGLYWRERHEQDTIKKTDGIMSLDRPDLSSRIFKSPVSRKPVDLQKLPAPAYHLLDMAFYTKRNISTIRPFYLRVGTVIATRGCTSHCSFCTESLTFTGGLRHHKVDDVIKTIRLLIETYHCDGITFLDNSFLADPDYARTVLQSIISSGLNHKALFCIQSRVDQITEDLARLLKQANFLKIEFGLESADPDVLLKTRKNASIQQAEKALQLCRRHGISTQANLIMGFEGDTIDKLDKTLSWIKRLPIDNVSWGQLFLSPGSLLYRQKAQAYLEKNDWSKTNIEYFFSRDHLSDFLPDELKSWRALKLNRYLKALHRRSVLRRNPLPRAMHYFWTRLLLKGKNRWQNMQNAKHLRRS